jgi:RNA polymerase sigma factor (sigma-70 family)
LVECNLRLVVYWARRNNPYGLPLEDLVQEGNLGLMQAIERFDPRQGVRLATYAQWWIRKALYKATLDHVALIRVPEKTRNEQRHLRRASVRLQSALARPPTLTELAAEAGLPKHRVANLQAWEHAYVSLEAPIASDSEASLADVLPDHKQATPDEALGQRLLRDHMQQAMAAHLSPDEQAYVRVRFGLDGEPFRTQLQAARHLGLTLKYAAQLEKRALRRLRRSHVLHEWRS